MRNTIDFLKIKSHFMFCLFEHLFGIINLSSSILNFFIQILLVPDISHRILFALKCITNSRDFIPCITSFIKDKHKYALWSLSSFKILDICVHVLEVGKDFT